MSETLPPLAGHPSLQLDFFQAGGFTRAVNGWVHRKTVPYMILLEPLEGCYRARFSGKETEVSRGQVLLVPADTPVEFTHHDGPRGRMSVRWLHLRFSVFGVADFFSFHDLPVLLPPKEARAVSRVIDRALGIESRPTLDPVRMVRQHELATRVLRSVCDVAAPKADAWPDENAWRRLAPVVRHIGRHLSGELTVNALAKAAALSPARLHALFQKELGSTPMRYVRRLRLEAASRRLVTTADTLAEIADKVGFADPFHLSRAFKACFGQSPRDYRKQALSYR